MVLHIIPKASPLPPAPLATSWLLICRLDGFERFAGLKCRFHSFCFTDLLIFRGLGRLFFKNSGSWDTTFSLFWWSLDASVHSEGTRIDFQWFLMDFGSPLETILDHFSDFLWFEQSKNNIWIAVTLFADFWMEILVNSDVLTLPKYGEYWCFY